MGPAAATRRLAPVDSTATVDIARARGRARPSYVRAASPALLRNRSGASARAKGPLTVRSITHRQKLAAASATADGRRVGRPHLRLVPRPRAAISAAMILASMVAALMLATVVLHTRLAERQLAIDELEMEVTDARERFDVLRRQRAELRSPNRLSFAAGELGLIQAQQTEFLPVDPYTLAEVMAAASTLDPDDRAPAAGNEPLEQIRRVKAAGEGQP